MKYPKVRPYFHQIQLMYITKNVDLEIEKDGLGRQGMVSKLYTLYHTKDGLGRQGMVSKLYTLYHTKDGLGRQGMVSKQLPNSLSHPGPFKRLENQIM